MNFWFLASVVLMFIVEPNINRINIVMIPWLYYTIVGTVDLAKRIPHGANAATAVFMVLFALFTHSYFTDYQEQISDLFFKGLGPAITQADARDSKRVYVSQYVNMPYVFALFYSQTDPNTYQATVQYNSYRVAFEDIASFDKYVFRIPEKPDVNENAVYVLRSWQLEQFPETEYQITQYDEFFLAEPLKTAE